MRVAEIYNSIQGEGVLAGTPMTIVRLQGCSVGCSFCDTKHSWNSTKGTEASVESILNCADLKWVLVTGGEPTEQGLGVLFRLLQLAGKRIALETAGTNDQDCLRLVEWLCVSPKLTYQEPLRAVIDRADELKFVVTNEASLNRIDGFLAKHEIPKWPRPPIISLQPVSQSPSATKLCIETCLARGWRLSVQLHKVLGLR